MKKLMRVITVLLLISGTLRPAFAYTSGYAGISNYGDCPYGNRAGYQYVTELQKKISSLCTQKFMLGNTNSNKYVFSSDWAYSVDFFAYSGHGLARTDDNALHFRTIGTDADNHSSADHSNATRLAKIEARTHEITLGPTIKYGTFYTCNFLTNGGSSKKQESIFRMFHGARLVMGFASQMYLDSREGKYYGELLSNKNYTIRNAFINAAKRYQQQRDDSDSIARVVGYSTAASDKLTVNVSALSSSLWYENRPSAYSIIDTVTIPHTGVHI